MTPLEFILVLLAAFLAGANLALIVEFREGLASWFTTKLISVIGLLIYIAMSAGFGNPAPWRVSFGIFVCIVDIYALNCIWRTLKEEKGKDHIYIHSNE